jgi:hypothetical protein
MFPPPHTGWYPESVPSCFGYCHYISCAWCRRQACASSSGRRPSPASSWSSKLGPS